MNRLFRRLSCVCFMLVFMGLVKAGYGFDISVYFDPWSNVRVNAEQANGWPMTRTCPNHDSTTWLRAVANNAEAIQWWRDMGVNRLCVHYTLNDFATLLPNDVGDTTFKVINYRWPERMYQFLEAQGYGRRAVLTDPQSQYVDTARCSGSWGCGARDTTMIVIPPNDQRPVLAIGPGNGTPQEFFRPAVSFDHWVGWGRREFLNDWRGPDSTLDYVMPMVFQIVLDYDRQANAPTAEIAKFYWYFKNSDSEWLRYYPVTIDTTMIHHQAGQFDTLTIRIDPIDYTYVRHGVGLDSVIYACSSPFDWTPSRSLDMDYFGPIDVAWGGREGRFEIRYSGYHTLYVYSVEAMDDAYYKMFRAPAAVRSAADSLIAAQFRTQYNTSRCLGWYYDEFPNSLINSFVNVNRTLQQHSLPTFTLNGWNHMTEGHGPRDSLVMALNNAGVQLPVMMSEFYPYGGDSTCRPDHPYRSPEESIWVRYDSEDPYWGLGSAACGNGSGYGTTWPRFDGTVSLQASFDAEIWGTCPLHTYLGIPCDIGGGVQGQHG